MKYIINDIPPSLNKFLGNSNNFNIYREKKIEWEWLTRLAIGINKPKIPYKKSIVTVTYYFKTKARHDPDNYAPKFLMDGLVKSGVLVDDSFDNVKLVIEGGYDKENPRTEIEIQEVKSD